MSLPQILNKLIPKKSVVEVNKKKSSYTKIAIATCFGTFLEWYDFLTFASLAVIFGPLFFPSSDPNSGLLASLAILVAFFSASQDIVLDAYRTDILSKEERGAGLAVWAAMGFRLDKVALGAVVGASLSALKTFVKATL